MKYTVTFIGRKAGDKTRCDYITTVVTAETEACIRAAVAAAGYEINALMEVRKR